MDHGVLEIERIRSELRARRRGRPRRIGRRIEYVESTTSTNDEAWRRAELDGPKGLGDAKGLAPADGLVIFAEHQSAGRGRMGRVWESPRGASLLCSVVVIDEGHELDGGDICLLTAVAAVDGISGCCDLAASIKWPNDVVADGRKLGGILIESRVRANHVPVWVIGIGINCLQQRGHLEGELAETATSLELLSAEPIERTTLAIALMVELDRWLARPQDWSAAELRTAWLARSAMVGERVVLEHAGKVHRGSIVDLDPSAALIVQLDEGGIRAFGVAETTVVRYGSSADST